MGVKAWNLIKSSKQFYVAGYRTMITLAWISMFISICLGVGIFYTYSIRPEPNYYSTYGETPPVPLVAMDEPNYSDHPLLPDDMTPDSAAKATVLQ